MVIATCILLVRNYTDGSIKILTVSRKNNRNDIGLPGGKMDDTDESLEHAAARELMEETGYYVNPKSLVKVLVADGDTGDDTITSCECTTFITQFYSCMAETNEKGIVAWLPIDSIIQSQCSFASYNTRLLKTLNLI